MGYLRGRTEGAAALAGDAHGVSSQRKGGGVGRKGESTGALSCLAWSETEVCTHLPTLPPSESSSSDVWELRSMEQNLWELHWPEPHSQ